ncbi:MAG: type I restriction enzyme HsdR N-terminal domain-containing protein, partial [Bacteroidota bacterium]
MILNTILRDSNYRLSQFNDDLILDLERSIFLKQSRGQEVPYVKCLVRRKDVRLTPEEVVRQLYIMVLNQEYGYPLERMELEYAVSFGRQKKRADIVIFDKIDPRAVNIIVEVKKPKLKDGKDQLKSYCHATGAEIGIWSNGESISYYYRKDPNYFEDIPDIPRNDQKLSDILEERWTIDDLIEKDKLTTERKSLKDLIQEMEDEVLANAGVDVFEEVFKLIFTKLYDEMESGRRPSRHLEFRNYGDTETELKAKIQRLFDKANDKWEGVFTEDSKIQLTPSHLSVC